MQIFKKVMEQFFYCLDSIQVIKLKVTIDHFKFDPVNSSIIVVYRLGRKKLLSKMDVVHFGQTYFNHISTFDQHRLTKISTLQQTFNTLFLNEICSKSAFINYVQKEVENERLL